MTTDSRPVRLSDDLPSAERLLSLSDNVIAFALTLLVLQVKVAPLSQVANPAWPPTSPPSSPSRAGIWSATRSRFTSSPSSG